MAFTAADGCRLGVHELSDLPLYEASLMAVGAMTGRGGLSGAGPESRSSLSARGASRPLSARVSGRPSLAAGLHELPQAEAAEGGEEQRDRAGLGHRRCGRAGQPRAHDRAFDGRGPAGRRGNQQFLVVLTAIAASVGAAGIPEAGTVTMTLIFKAVGLDLSYIPVLLTVDWFLDRCRTAINIMGDVNVSCLLDGYIRETHLPTEQYRELAEIA